MPPVESFTLAGFRSFRNPQEFKPAIPNGRDGSGLTFIVGPNASGKSALLEALEFASGGQGSDFPREFRHDPAEYSVSFSLLWSDNVQWDFNRNPNNDRYIGVSGVQTAKRGSRKIWYVHPDSLMSEKIRTDRSRTQVIEERGSRLRRPSMRDVPARRVDRWRGDNTFVATFEKFVRTRVRYLVEGDGVSVEHDGHAHEPNGLGSGIVRLLDTIDAVYDATDGDVIIIDEPELSLHPAWQRELSRVLCKFAQKLQLIVATHSPYIVDWGAICGGARVVRISRSPDGAVIAPLRPETVEQLRGFIDDMHNPHVLGTNGTEALFLPDQLVLVEGTEDVVTLRRAEQHLGLALTGDLFGWGVGGASKMGIIAQMLADLGYQRVFGLVDGDMSEVAKQLSEKFPAYAFHAHSQPNIRDAQKNGREVIGLCDSRGIPHREHEAEMRSIFERITKYMTDPQ